MGKTSYGFRKELDVSYQEAIKKVTEALKQEGFGVLTEIDVQAVLKKKLDVDFRPYVILGACNPPLAYQSLQAEREIGLLLPCNVIVYQGDSGKTVVSAIDPVAAMSMIENEKLPEIASQVAQKLRRVIESL
ncbi:MAG TPA: DUF302 domain-containing protein [Deltaproteobacteria bacterium]|nr:MAG: hypothetical protein DRQ00_09175 [candidate division KSB1 bacterium]HDM78575.1 DUF302 domain-containing protein [Deltaproteobacteria bacterium]